MHPSNRRRRGDDGRRAAPRQTRSASRTTLRPWSRAWFTEFYSASRDTSSWPPAPWPRSSLSRSVAGSPSRRSAPRVRFGLRPGRSTCHHGSPEREVTGMPIDTFIAYAGVWTETSTMRSPTTSTSRICMRRRTCSMRSTPRSSSAKEPRRRSSRSTKRRRVPVGCSERVSGSQRPRGRAVPVRGDRRGTAARNGSGRRRAGSLAGHAAAGMSRSNLKDLGESLDSGEAGLVVVAVADMGAKVEASR